MAVDPEDIRKARDAFERQAIHWKIEGERYTVQAGQATDQRERAAQLAGAASAREASDQAQQLANRQDSALAPALKEQAAAQAREAAQAELRAAREAQLQAEKVARDAMEAERNRRAARAHELDLELARSRIERGNGRHANRYRDL